MAVIPTSGEFTKVPEGGGSGEFVFTFTGGTAPNEPETCDKTFAEVDAAYKAGAQMRPRWAGGIMFPIEADLVFFKTSDGEDNIYSGAMNSPASSASVECTISRGEVSISFKMD